MSETLRQPQDNIIPAILSVNTVDLEAKLAELPGEIKLVHIDVLEEDIWTTCNVDFEVHLMVKEPEAIVDRWIDRGAKRIVVHALGSRTSKRDSAEVGLAVELHVPLAEVYPLIPKVDFLNLMSIAEIGAQGHPFDERIFDRIKEVKEKFPQIVLCVDGGINVTNYQSLVDLGVDRLVVGSGFKDLWQSLMQK